MNCLEVHELCDKKMFLFSGAPDIIINDKALLVGGQCNDMDDDYLTSGDELVENSMQRNPLQGAYTGSLPEKVGEVFGGLHMLLICRILKTLRKDKRIRGRYEVKGSLLDKMCGVIHCSLGVELTAGTSSLMFKTGVYEGSLSPAKLCSHIQMNVGFS